MPGVAAETDRQTTAPCGNVADRLTAIARQMPDAVAIVDARDQRAPIRMTFRELDEESNRLASGLSALGVRPGGRMALLVPFGREFITLTFALLKAGAVTVLVDPGMGRRSAIDCLAEAAPEGFITVRFIDAARRLLGRKFPHAKTNFVVGKKRFFGTPSLEDARRAGSSESFYHAADSSDPAAIIFTSGGTGIAKGVLYRHGNFTAQVRQVAELYSLSPGAVDLACFPLFGLFNAFWGVTTVIPRMNFSRAAQADPAVLAAAIRMFGVTQSFASPAVWERVGRYCQEQQIRLDSLRKVFSAGAPVSPRVLESMTRALPPQAQMHTPYGATEALPVSTIEASEVLSDTQKRWASGGGTCVGRRVPEIEWRVIEIVDGPIPTIHDTKPLPSGQIGELIVSGPAVTQEYATRTEANALAKIADRDRFWHRMGDAGYLDEQDRFWFCGRLAHRVRTAQALMFTICCEAIFNQHPRVHRSALVGIGSPGAARPVIVAEPWSDRWPRSRNEQRRLCDELAALAKTNPLTASIADFLLIRAMPVDVRHNAKIFRERLAAWAASKLR